MRGIPLTSSDLANNVREAGDTSLLITPGVDAPVAEALRERAKRGNGKTSVVIDGSHHGERIGYGETSTWRGLMKATRLRTMPGTRLGLLVTEHGAWIFAPRAGRLDPREEEGLTAVDLGAHRGAARLLCERILGQTSPSSEGDVDLRYWHREEQSDVLSQDAAEPRARSGPITEEEVKQAEEAIQAHPPRDYVKEREITVYTAFVGYIEIRLTGASLGKGARLKIPDELVERGLGETELRRRINESVKISLEEEVDTGVREVNQRLNAIRTLYTRQLGSPHGRVYRKRQRKELEMHLEDLRKEIEQANSALGDKIEAALLQQLDNLAETYAGQTVQEGLPDLNKEDMIGLLLNAWHEAGTTRPNEVRLEVTFKDLTWEALQDGALRARIVELFPDLAN